MAERIESPALLLELLRLDDLGELFSDRPVVSLFGPTRLILGDENQSGVGLVLRRLASLQHLPQRRDSLRPQLRAAIGSRFHTGIREPTAVKISVPRVQQAASGLAAARA